MSTKQDRAFATGLAWIRQYCQREGWTVMRAENLNSQFPEEVRPYQALGRVTLSRLPEA